MRGRRIVRPQGKRVAVAAAGASVTATAAGGVGTLLANPSPLAILSHDSPPYTPSFSPPTQRPLSSLHSPVGSIQAALAKLRVGDGKKAPSSAAPFVFASNSPEGSAPPPLTAAPFTFGGGSQDTPCVLPVFSIGSSTDNGPSFFGGAGGSSSPGFEGEKQEGEDHACL
jgi:hypothetical protein